MDKLGIIGGMGPLATQLLYREITERTDASCDQEHIDMIILSHAKMPDRTEAIRSGNTDEVKSLLLEDAKFLERSGASAIAIPCNTSHYFWDFLQDRVNIPIINMVRETVKAAASDKPRKIGVLATDGTVFTGIYRKECENAGVEYFTPDALHQKIVMRIIYDQIKKGVPGSDEDFAKIDRHLKENGCDAGILACTELSCYAKQNGVSSFYTDALDILCERSILICGAKLKKTGGNI